MKPFEGIFDVDGKEKKLDEIGKLMADPSFWDSNGENQRILRERASILDSITPWKQEHKELEEMGILLQLVEEQKDEQAHHHRGQAHAGVHQVEDDPP